jgi:cytochrome d ubiquinol oxidase subunit II
VIADAVGSILFVSLTLYAVLAGADFGGGFWDLVAGGERRGRAPRHLIDESITPVWEANHVWLIFILVIFWTSFPTAFAAVMTAAATPLWLAALGIVLRGAGFAFRKEVETLRWRRLLGATFAFSSLITPFFMGTVIGAVAAGKITLDAKHTNVGVWTGLMSVLIGALFVAVCAYLAAVYLITEAIRRSNHPLERYFTHRAELAGVVSGALSLATLLEVRHSDPLLYDRLTGRALVLVVVAGVSGLAVLLLLVQGRRRGLRVLSALGVVAVVWGWGVAQYPRLLPGTSLTLANGSAPHATLVCIVVIFVLAVVLVGPSFVILFSLQGRRLLKSENHEAASP